MSKTLPKEITSYDLLKTFAIITMIIDHVAAYLYPDLLWMRVIGRFSVPVWFFLIGYARSRDLGKPLWIGAAILIVSDVVIGANLMPLNILGTIILTRLLLNPFMKLLDYGKFWFWAGCAFLLFMFMFTGVFFDYGTMGMIIAIFGYLVRHQDDIKGGQGMLYPFAMFTIITYTVTQWMYFLGINGAQGLTMFIGTLLIILGLYKFRPATFPALTKSLGPLAHVLQFTGRHTLEIYVVHLLIIKALLLYLHPDTTHMFQWYWFR